MSNTISNQNQNNKSSAVQENNDISLSVISDLTYSNIWNSFTKWCQDQAETKHYINIHQFCDIFYMPEKPIEGLLLKLSDYFLKQNNLIWDKEESSFSKFYQIKYPELDPKPVKLNIITIAKELSTKGLLVQNGLSNLFNSIGQILSANPTAQIDLGALGILSSSMGTIKQTPNKLKNDTVTNKKTTMKSLIGRTKHRATTDGVSEEPPPTDEFGLTQKQLSSAMGHEDSKNALEDGHKTKNLPQNFQYKGKKLSEVCKNNVIEIPKLNAKWKLKEMLNSTFKRVYIQKVKPNPVLFNDYSNTKAAPFTAEKTQIPISHRIGSFYTLSLQNYIVDVSSKSIKRLYDEYFDRYRNITFDQPATELEEYLFILGNDNIDENKIILKKEAYQRYNDFILHSINDNFIAEMKNEWFISIINNANKSYQVKKYGNLLDECLKEISRDYKISMKTSILDYILKHPEQREKLNIPVPFRKLKEYSEERITRPSDGNMPWKENWEKNKLALSNNLYIMCENVTKIMKYFEDHLKNTSYIDLNENDVSWGTLKLTNFLENQKTQFQLQTKNVSEKWMKFVEKILKENKIYKDQLILYFKSVSGLMSSELRKLVIGSIERYYNFITQFQKKEYISAQEIFDKQYTLDVEFQKSFIEVDIIEGPDNEQFTFSDETSQIQLKLMSVIEDIIENTSKVARPDNMFIKNIDKRANLWAVPAKDSVVVFMRNEIEKIIKENIEVVSKVTDLYQPFLFIMKEKKAIEAFVSSKPSRDDYRKKITFYEEKLKLLNKMPIALYMNMIKVNCDDINKKIRSKIEDSIDELLKSIQSENILDKAKKLIDKCESIKAELETTVNNEKDLYEKETKYEDHKSETVPGLFREYDDYIEWIFFYLSYDTYNVYEQVKEGVNTFEQNLQSCHSSFNAIEHTLKTQGNEIEIAKKKYIIDLEKKKKELDEEVKDLRRKIDKIKEELNSFYGKEKEFLPKVKDNYDQILRCGSDLKEINEKETYLGIAFQTEDDRIEQCRFDLDPIKQYFEFASEFSDYRESCSYFPIFQVDFEYIEKEILSKYELFEISEKKISSNTFKKKIAAKRKEFDLFKDLLDKIRLIYPIFEIFKNWNDEAENVVLDNRFYCHELSKYFPDKYHSDDKEKVQQDFYGLTVSHVYVDLLSNIEKKNAEISKVVEDWENVLKMHKNKDKYNAIFKAKFELVKHNKKEFYVVAKDNLEKIITTLTTNIKEIDEYLNSFESPSEEVLIIKAYTSWKNFSTDLLEVIQKIKDTQEKLTDFMDKIAKVKEKEESMQYFREAENLFRSIIEELQKDYKFKDEEDKVVDAKLMIILLIKNEKKAYFLSTLDDISKSLNDLKRSMNN